MKQVIFFFLFIATLPVLLLAQLPDTVTLKKDSTIKQLAPVPVTNTDSTLKNILQENNLLNSSGTPVSLVVELKKEKRKDTTFYVIVGMLLLLAFFRFFFPRYFTNLFRVFFNTSLRQSQLTDQLLQAKFPSLPMVGKLRHQARTYRLSETSVQSATRPFHTTSRTKDEDRMKVLMMFWEATRTPTHAAQRIELCRTSLLSKRLTLVAERSTT